MKTLSFSMALVVFVALAPFETGRQDLALRKFVADGQATETPWLKALRDGKAIQVIESVYERGSEGVPHEDPSFVLPDSTMNHFWLMFPDGSPPIFCGYVDYEGTVIQRFDYLPDKNEFLSSDTRTARSLSISAGAHSLRSSRTRTRGLSYTTRSFREKRSAGRRSIAKPSCYRQCQQLLRHLTFRCAPD